MSEMIRVDLYLTNRQIRKIEALQKEKGMTKSKILRKSVDFYFDFLEYAEKQKKSLDSMTQNPENN